MDQYVTGATIKSLREDKNMTQSALAEVLGVSDKTISKWETGRGLPDITLIEPLADALSVSTIELLSGDSIINRNRSFNLRRTKLYVCPVCGNIIHAMGDTVISCCGITLPPLEAEMLDDETDDSHAITLEEVEDEYLVTLNHPMTKEHYISFVGIIGIDGIQMIKLYPEGECMARVKRRGTKEIYAYCNKHGLYKLRVTRR